MLTTDETKFITYWEANRLHKKRSFGQFTIGIPLSVIIILAIFISVITGWHKRAEMVLRANASYIIVIVIAAIAIFLFITIFSIRYQWEQNEQRYKELLFKKQNL